MKLEIDIEIKTVSDMPAEINIGNHLFPGVHL